MPNSSNVKETIDSRILRLLGLEDVFDLDYDTYLILLKEAIVKNSFGKNKLPDEELALLANERKRIRGKSGRFKVKNKKINTQSFGIGKVKIVPKKIQSEKLLPGTQTQSYLPGGELSPIAAGSTSYLKDISESIGNIIKILNSSIQLEKKSAEKKRLEKEKSKREGEESKLEKGFSLVKKAVSKVIAPVKNILSSIIDFFMKMFLGRVVYKLLEWLADPKNQDKLKSVFRFLGDHWSKLLSLYIMFGTSFGKFARGLISIVIKGGAALARATAVLLAKAGIGKAGKVAGFLGGKYGKLAVAGLEAATTVGATMALSGGLESFGGIGNDSKEKPTIPKFAGGGFADLGSLFKMGSNNMIGSLSEMLGFDRFREQTAGLINGQKGIDKIPAMLTDGEFVMSRGAVQKYGVNTLEAMNAAGGGTNKPKMLSGTVYAQGGGMVGESPDLKEKPPERGLRPNVDDVTKTSQSNFRKSYFEERLKRIENQLKVQRTLSSGKGVNIKGSTLGTQIGKGFGSTYKGRQSIVVPGAAKTGWEPEITIGGMRYFGQVRGGDVIYSSNYAKGLSGQVDKYGARNKSYKGRGGGIVSNLSEKDKKNLPKTKIMMGPDGPFVGYLRYKNGNPEYARPTQRNKGMLESLGDFFDPKGAKNREETLNARSMRLTGISDLEDMRRRGMKEEHIKKMLDERLGSNGYSRAINDLKAKQTRIKKEDLTKKQARMGNYSASNIVAAQKSAQIKPKPLSKGVQPLSKKPPVVRRRSKADLVGSGINQSTRPTSPKISASHPAGTKNKEATLGLRR
jgi:hypothetical protein